MLAFGLATVFLALGLVAVGAVTATSSVANFLTEKQAENEVAKISSTAMTTPCDRMASAKSSLKRLATALLTMPVFGT